jgi:hypothetical protein
MKAGDNFSSVHGKIRHLLMEFDSTNVQQPMRRMVALKRAMPEVKFLLWCSRPDVQEAVCDQLRYFGIPHTAQMYHEPETEASDCLVVYELFSGVNSWIRDAFFISYMENDQCLLLDTVAENGADQGWVKRMAKMKLLDGPRFTLMGQADTGTDTLGIAGGDVLIDDKWVFLGKSAPVFEALLQQHYPESTVVVLHERSACPELYHLDLFMTLTGQIHEEKYVVMVAECLPLQPEFAPTAERLNTCLHNIARRLTHDYPIHVIRNPMPIDHHLYAYNNCLVEVTPDQRTVWLPAYSYDFPQYKTLHQFEIENQNLWTNLHFNPITVNTSFMDLLGIKAGLHCITNEVREKNF